MPDVLIAAWFETATIRAMALSPADPTPLVLVGNTSVPPPEVWHEVSHRAACRAFPDDNVLTHRLVQVADDGYIVPAGFHTETVRCNTMRVVVERSTCTDRGATRRRLHV